MRPLASETRAVKDVVPLSGVPLRFPEDDRVSPEGSEPEATLQSSGGLPPEASSEVE
jgi:hypothetical protein